ncbi:MAG TPA: hypothetical protein VN223_10405 [Candidatus Elarobacter sp.]|nr:hypothetical protein [Candidatus Elarobacter sp.]
MLTYVHKAHLQAPAKRAKWGWALVAASLPFFWNAWVHHGTHVIPMIVGVNLVFGGLRMVYWNAGGTEKRRSVLKKSI